MSEHKEEAKYKIRVLVADDNALYRRELTMSLEGAEDIEIVAEASTGEQALDLVESLEPEVVLVDNEMRGLTGVEATHLIRAMGSAARVFVVAGNEAGRKPSMLSGAEGYFIKGKDLDGLLEAIRDPLARLRRPAFVLKQKEIAPVRWIDKRMWVYLGTFLAFLLVGSMIMFPEIVFPTVSLFLGLVFFAYGLKYYLSVALLLSTTRNVGGANASGNGNGNGFGKGHRNGLRKGRRNGGGNGRRNGLRSGGIGQGLRNGIGVLREDDVGFKAKLSRLIGGLLSGRNGGNGRPEANGLKRGVGINGLGNGDTGKSQKLSPEQQPFISIQLPLYNESRVVDRLLDACTRLDYENYEVLVADDSTDGTVEQLERWAKHPRVKISHRINRTGFKGAALKHAVEVMDPRTQFVAVFDADFIPPPDVLHQFLSFFVTTTDTNGNGNGGNGNGGSGVRLIDDSLGVVQGYQWHVLNASENWITKGIRSEFAGSYVVERSGQELLGSMKMIAGSVFMIRADILRGIGWGTSITEDWELTLRLYLNGYRVLYSPFVQAPAECVAEFKQLTRQRMRWAEGHTFNVKKYFLPILFSPRVTMREKLEFLYYAPYYLQSVLFLLGTVTWLISELVLKSRLPFWSETLGWSLVFTNTFALVLMNLTGLFLERGVGRNWTGLLSFVLLSFLLAPYQAYAALKALFESHEGGWHRTQKTGIITDVVDRLDFGKRLKRKMPKKPARGSNVGRRLGAPFARVRQRLPDPLRALLMGQNRLVRGRATAFTIVVLIVALIAVGIPAARAAFSDTSKVFYFDDNTTPLQYMMVRTQPNGSITTTDASGTFYSETFPAGWQIASGDTTVDIYAVSGDVGSSTTLTLKAGTSILGTGMLTIPADAVGYYSTSFPTSQYEFSANERLSLEVGPPGEGVELSWDGDRNKSRLVTPTQSAPNPSLALLLLPVIVPLATSEITKRRRLVVRMLSVLASFLIVLGLVAAQVGMVSAAPDVIYLRTASTNGASPQGQDLTYIEGTTEDTLVFDDVKDRIYWYSAPAFPENGSEASIAGGDYALNMHFSQLPDPWWNTNYLFRKRINITAGAENVPSGYSIRLEFDHAALTSAQSLSNGDDIRVVYWNGNAWTELDRRLDDQSSWDTATTQVWFQTQVGIGPTKSDTNYYLYYGNSSASSPPTTWSSVFLFYDDFNDLSLDSGSWTCTRGTCSQSGGYLTLDTDSSVWASSGNALGTDTRWEARIRIGSDGSVSNSYYWGATTEDGFAGDYIALMSDDTGHAAENSYLGSTTTTSYSPSTPDSFHNYSFIRQGSSEVRYIQDTTQVASNTSDVPTGDLRAFVWNDGTAFSQDIDFVRVRRFVTSEPTTGLETEEDAPFVKIAVSVYHTRNDGSDLQEIVSSSSVVIDGNVTNPYTLAIGNGAEQIFTNADPRRLRVDLNVIAVYNGASFTLAYDSSANPSSLDTPTFTLPEASLLLILLVLMIPYLMWLVWRPKRVAARMASLLLITFLGVGIMMGLIPKANASPDLSHLNERRQASNPPGYTTPLTDPFASPAPSVVYGPADGDGYRERLDLRQWNGTTRQLFQNGHPTNRYVWEGSTTPRYYQDAEGQWRQIDSDWRPSIGPWDFEMVHADYNAFAMRYFNAAELIKYLDPPSGQFVTFQALPLEYTNDLGLTEAIADSRPVEAGLTGNQLYWTGAFGAGFDLKWVAGAGRLGMSLIIQELDALPQPSEIITAGGNPALKLQFLLRHSPQVGMWVNGEPWREQSGGMVETSGIVEFRSRHDGRLLWKFNLPLSYDARNDEGPFVGTFRFRRTSEGLVVEHLVPLAFIQQTDFPMEIDLSIDEYLAAGAVEYGTGAFNNCDDELKCYSDTSSTSNDYRARGLRWDGVTVPKDAQIDVAYLSFFLTTTISGRDINHDIYFHDADNPADFNTNQNISSQSQRPRTSASSSWVETQTGSQYNHSPSIVSVVQEIVNREGWASGQAMVALLIPKTDAKLQVRFEAHENTPSNGPQLHIEYTTSPTETSNCQATYVSDTQIDVGWNDNSDNETGFEIERSTDGGVFSQIDTANPEVTSYPDTSTSADHSYQYRVRAYNGAGNSAFCSATLTIHTSPDTPSHVTATYSHNREISVTWRDNSSYEDQFRIERSKNGGAYVLLANDMDASPYVDSTITQEEYDAGDTFIYRVRSDISSQSLISAWAISNVVVVPDPSSVFLVLVPLIPCLVSFIWERKRLTSRLTLALVSLILPFVLLSQQITPVTAAPDLFYLRDTTTNGASPAGEDMNNTQGSSENTMIFNDATDQAYWYTELTYPEGGDDAVLSAGTYELKMYFTQLPSTWYDTAWLYRKKITIQASKVVADQTTFPVLINLASDSDLSSYAKSNGGDILFTSTNGTTKLDHDLEKYVTGTGELVVWVEVTNLSSSNPTDIYMYYGNSGASDQWNANATWDGNYKAVWHLKEDPTGAAPQFFDSTTTNNSGTAQPVSNEPSQTSGRAGYGLLFDDTLERHVTVADETSLDLSTTMTVSAWFQSTDTDTDVGLIVNKWGTTSANRNYWLGKINNNIHAFYVDDSQNVTADWTLVDDGVWHYVVGVADATNSLLRIYVDGFQENTAAYDGTSVTGSSDLHIGSASGSTLQEFNGKIDEVRVSNSVRTAAWIETEWNNQNSPSTFYTVASTPDNAPKVDIIVSVYHTDSSGGTASEIVTSSTITIDANTPNPYTLPIGSGTEKTFTNADLRRLRTFIDVTSVNGGGSFTLAYDSAASPSNLSTPALTVPELGLLFMLLVPLIPYLFSMIWKRRRAAMQIISVLLTLSLGLASVSLAIEPVAAAPDTYYQHDTSTGVRFEEAQTGSVGSSTTVATSASLTAANNHLYLAAVSTYGNIAVSSVSGLGLTWTLAKLQCGAEALSRMEVWRAIGTPSASGVVTATLASTAKAVIAVTRYSGVNTSSPIGNTASANTLGAGGACSGGSKNGSYTVNLTTTVDGSYAYGAVASMKANHTEGSGYTERAEIRIGGQGTDAGVGVEDKLVQSTSTVAVDGTLSRNTDWAVVAVEIKGETAIDPPGMWMNTTVGTGGVTATYDTAGQNSYWYSDVSYPTGSGDASIAAGNYTANMYFNTLPSAGTSVQITVTASHTATGGSGATTIVSTSTTIDSTTANPLALNLGSGATQTFTSADPRRLRLRINVTGVTSGGSFILAYDGSCASSQCSNLDTPVVTVPENAVGLVVVASLIPGLAHYWRKRRRESVIGSGSVA